RVVLRVRAEHGDDHLHVVAVALGEERADGAVGQARGEDGVLGRAALALDEAAGDLADGVEALLDVDGEREEVDALARGGAGRGRAGEAGAAVAHEGGPAGLLGEAAGLDAEHAAADGGLYSLCLHVWCPPVARRSVPGGRPARYRAALGRDGATWRSARG